MKKMGKDFLFTQSLCFRNIVDDFNSDIYASIIGYEECSKNKPLIDSNKSCYVFHFVVKGKGYLYYKNQVESISQGECFMISPNSHVKYRPDSKDPWQYFWMEVNGNLVKKILNCVDFPSHNMHIALENISTIFDYFLDLLDEEKFLRNTNAETLRVNSILLNIFSCIISEYGKEEHSPLLSKEEIQIKKIIEYINSNYTSPNITIKKIADYFFFDQAYLTRIFKKNMGVSPMKYIIYLRMQRAVELLKKKKAFSISQIAYALGYKNQFYFSKEFKKHFGVPPSKYIA